MIKLDDNTWVDPKEVEMMQIDLMQGAFAMYRLIICTRNSSQCLIISTERAKLESYAQMVSFARMN